MIAPALVATRKGFFQLHAGMLPLRIFERGVHLAGGLVGSMLLFAILYVSKINNYVCIAVAFGAGGGSIGFAYKLSDKYGEHGLMKRMAKGSIPKVLKSYSRKVFIKKD